MTIFPRRSPTPLSPNPLPSIWVTDVKSQRHDILVDGFDISLAQCPVPEVMPEASYVAQHDILSEIPPELQGQYDVVHVRLFLVAIRNDDPVPVLRNLVSMLSTSRLIYCLSSEEKKCPETRNA